MEGQTPENLKVGGESDAEPAQQNQTPTGSILYLILNFSIATALVLDIIKVFSTGFFRLREFT
jgi:hypothetical protein